MKEGITPTSRVRINDDVVFRDLQGEIVLLNLKTGVYFGLDPMGTRIWHLIREKQSLQEVLDALLEEYEVTEAQCSQDLFYLVARMAEKELVEITDRATP